MALQVIKHQLLHRPPYPTTSFAGQTILVTGTNVGLGHEAVKHFQRLGAARIIATVRSTALAPSLPGPPTSVVEFWPLDYTSPASIRAFAALAAAELPRLDRVVLSAGVAATRWEAGEDGVETSVAVNVVGSALLAVLLLPLLRRSARRWNVDDAVLAVVSSGAHAYASFPERGVESILGALNDPLTANMAERYQTTKLLQLLYVRELAARTAALHPLVTIHALDPGFCATRLTRHVGGPLVLLLAVMKAAVAWTAEQGGRALVEASTAAGRGVHGGWLSMVGTDVSPFVTSTEGQEAQQKIWAELVEKLDSLAPGAVAAALESDL